MDRPHHIIAIDGYSSCGKSTLAKALAEKLGYTYVDSGAMYRAVTLFLMRSGIPLHDQVGIAAVLPTLQIDFKTIGGERKVFLNEEDVSDEIRQMHVSEQVSEVSAIKAVREALVKQQQQLGARRSIIMDGRDIGTTVFPNASLKIFMTAEPTIRAERRYAELSAKGESVTLEEVMENLHHRDTIDTTRTESPLIQAADAVVLDNSNLSESQQLQFVVDLIDF